MAIRMPPARPGRRHTAFVRFLFAVVLGFGGLVSSGASTCWACDCVGNPPAELARTAPVAFVGTVTEVDLSDVGQASNDPVHYRVAVERVYKGEVGARATVDSPASSGSCGLAGVTQGSRYLFLAQSEGEKLTTTQCSGTVALYSGEVPSSYGLGPGQAVAAPAAATTSAAAQVTTMAAEPSTRSAEPRGSQTGWVPAAVLLGVAALGLTIYLTARRRRGSALSGQGA